MATDTVERKAIHKGNTARYAIRRPQFPLDQVMNIVEINIGASFLDNVSSWTVVANLVTAYVKED